MLHQTAQFLWDFVSLLFAIATAILIGGVVFVWTRALCRNAWKWGRGR